MRPFSLTMFKNPGRQSCGRPSTLAFEHAYVCESMADTGFFPAVQKPLDKQGSGILEEVKAESADTQFEGGTHETRLGFSRKDD